MSEITIELCAQKHTHVDQRVDTLENYVKETRTDMKAMEASYAENLQRLYLRIDEGLKRPPVWATILMTVLGSVCAGLAVAIVK